MASGGTDSATVRWLSRRRPLIEPALVVLTVGALAGGGIAWLAGWRDRRRRMLDRRHMACGGAGVGVGAGGVAPGTGRGGSHRGAVAGRAPCWCSEYLAGALIAVMLAGGRALDAAAERRASHDLRALLEHAPRFARRRVGDQVSVIPLADVAVDDLLVVGPGEVVPVDGRVVDAVAVLDESVLTGEPLQVERGVGEPVRSGVVNAGTAFELRATATAEDSTYAGIVRLAATGRRGERADRAVGRPVRGVVLAAGAAACRRGLAGQRVGGARRRGAGGGDAVSAAAGGAGGDRVRSVAGFPAGVVIRSGGALENLGHATTLVMDKTGTLTMGRPVVVDVVGRTRLRYHRGAAAGRVGGSDVAARAGRGHRDRSAHPRPAVVAARPTSSKSLAAASPPPSAAAG